MKQQIKMSDQSRFRKSGLALAVAAAMMVSGGAMAADVEIDDTPLDVTEAGAANTLINATAEVAGDAAIIDAHASTTVMGASAVKAIDIANSATINVGTAGTVFVEGDTSILAAKTLTFSLGADDGATGTNEAATTLNVNDATNTDIFIAGADATTRGGSLTIKGAGAAANAQTFTMEGSMLLDTVTLTGGASVASGNVAGEALTSTLGNAAADTIDLTGLVVSGGASTSAALDVAGGASTATVTGTLTIGADGIAVTGAAAGSTDSDGSGGAATLTVSEAATIGGAVTVTGGASGAESASDNGGNAALTFSKAVTSTSTLTLVGGTLGTHVDGTEGTSTVTLKGDATFTGIVLTEIVNGGAATLVVGNGLAPANANAQVITGATTFTTDGEGAITINNMNASGAKFVNDIGTTGASAKRAATITVSNSADVGAGTAYADFNGNVYADAIAITATNADQAASATFAGNVDGNITLTKDTAEATVTFDGSSVQTVTGNIVAASDADGLVVISNDVNLTGEIGASSSNGVGNVRIASGKTLTLTSGAASDGLYTAGKLDADSADTRGGTVTLVGSNAAAEDTAGTTQISQIDGTTTLTAVNITGGTGGLSDDGDGSSPGEVGGASSATFVGASDITTVTLSGGTGGAGLANDADDTDGGVGGATTGTFTAALTATNVNVNAGTGGAGGAGGASAPATGSEGGAGGNATLDLNVATGTTQAIGTLTITGGTGGDGGATSTNVGAAGGDAGDALATIAGDITGNIVLDDGVAGTSVTDGGAGGALGTATVTFDGEADQEIAGNITAAANDEGAIILTNASRAAADIVTITGGIGSSTASVNTLTTVNGANELANVKVTGDVYVKTINQGEAANWDEDVAATMDLDGNVNFTTFNISAGTASAAEDATVTVAGNMTGTTIALIDASGNGSSTLTLDGTSAQTITAAITASADALGNISVTNTGGTVTFSGAIGNASGSKAVEGISLAASSTTVFEELVDASTLSASGALTIEKAVTLASTLTTADDSSITLGSAFKSGGSVAITAADSTSTLDQTADTVTVNLSSQFNTGSVTLLDNNATLDATDLAAFKVTDTALVDYTIALGETGAADDSLIISATKRTTAQVASNLGMSASRAASLGQVTTALASGDAAASTALDTVLVAGGTTAKNAVEQMNPDAGAGSAAAAAGASAVAGVVGGRQSNTAMASNRYGTAKFASNSKYGQSGLSTGDAADEGVIWGQLFGGNAKQDAAGGIDGYDSSTAGIVFGVEKEEGGHLLGASLSYSDTGVDGKSASLSKTDSKAVQASLYGTTYATDGYADWMVGYADGNNDSKRTINFGGLNRTASGSYDSDIWMAKVGYNMPMTEGEWMVTPRGELSWTRISTDGYTETGAGNLNLIVNEADSNIVTMGAGADFATRIQTTDGVTVPRVSLMANYDLTNDRAETTSTFTGGGSSFKTQGIDPEKFGVTLGLGVDFESNDDETVFSLDYNGDFKSGFDSHMASVTLRKNF